MAEFAPAQTEVTARLPAPPSGRTSPPPKARTLRMIGNAHIDPVWLWRWPEGLQEVWATFRSALDRLSEYPEAVFTASSAAFYDWIERSDPAMFAEIRARVAEGRWSIVGGWWVEADCNLPSGESFVRQALYAQRFFERAFGRIATVGYNPDAFGHNAMLPQLLRKAGLERYVFMRPQAHEASLPPLFWWEAPDGSRVLAARLAHEYCSPTDDLERYVDATLGKLDAGEWDDALCFYGVGNHGGGPTKANLDGIRRMDADPARPSLRHADLDSYFRRLAARDASHQRPGSEPLPVWRGELQHHARGCYAAHSAVKHGNRSTEQLLVTAEKVCALAAGARTAEYPDDFEAAWRSLLFNQFHDILAGTSIESAYDDTRDALGEARAIGARNLQLGLQSIARRIDIAVQPEAWPIVVFNPHAWPVRIPVELEFRRVRDGDVLVDESDRSVPYQLAQSEATVNGSRARLVFLPELPATGFRVFRLLTGEAAAAALPPNVEPLPAGDAWAETERLRLDVDVASGTFRLTDRTSGAEIVSRGGRAVVYEDDSDTWSHGVERFETIAGEFRPVSVRLVEHGPVRAVIRITARHGGSRLVQDVALYRGLDQVRVGVRLDLREPRRAVKLRFRTPLRDAVATFEIPYGSIERPAGGAEEPGQAWLDVTGRLPERRHGRRVAAATAGLSLLNDAKYSYDVAGGELGMTIARSAVYAHHEPALPDPDREYAYLDAGLQRFSYALLPHGGDWRLARTPRATCEVLQPPIAQPETFHAGSLSQRVSFAEVDHPAVIVSALKVAEDRRGLVLRAVETAGGPARATIALPAFGRWIDAVFGPFELKTYLVPFDDASAVIETDLLERPAASASPAPAAAPPEDRPFFAAASARGPLPSLTARRRPTVVFGHARSARYVGSRSRRYP